jgi:hypothetical protein
MTERSSGSASVQHGEAVQGAQRDEAERSSKKD